MSSKGQGLSLNTIVIAVIVIVVLVVLVMSFTGYLRKGFVLGVENCESARGGKCRIDAPCSQFGEKQIAKYELVDDAVKSGCIAPPQGTWSRKDRMNSPVFCCSPD